MPIEDQFAQACQPPGKRYGVYAKTDIPEKTYVGFFQAHAYRVADVMQQGDASLQSFLFSPDMKTAYVGTGLWGQANLPQNSDTANVEFVPTSGSIFTTRAVQAGEELTLGFATARLSPEAVGLRSSDSSTHDEQPASDAQHIHPR